MSAPRLTDRFFAVLGLGILVGVLALVVPHALVFYVALLVALTLITASDLGTLARPGSLSAAWSVPRNPTLGQRVTVEAELVPKDASIGRLSQIEVFAPETELLNFSKVRASIQGPPALESRAMRATFHADVIRLGYERVDHIEIGVRSRLGLWYRPGRLKTPAVDFRVAPESREISERAFSEMISAQRLLFEGARLQARSRAPDQFLTARKYQYPDSIRHIDQKKTAKLGQLMTRVFDSFFSHHVVVALDMGRAMCGRIENSSKHDFYLSAALLLARNAAKSRDRVSFFSFSRDLHHLIAKTRSLAPFDGLFRGTKTFVPREEESEFDIINRTVAKISGQRSIVIVLTDVSRPSVQDALLETLGPLCGKHIVVVLSLADKTAKLDEKILAFRPDRFGPNANAFDDVYAGFLYDYWANEEFLLFRSRLSKIGGAALQVTQDNWMSVVDRLYHLLRNSIYA